MLRTDGRCFPPSPCFLPRQKQTGEITNLAGCDFLTISPALLKELQDSTEDLPRVLSPEKAGQAEPMSKTSFIDNEPAFRWSLVQDPMANEKLTEGESAAAIKVSLGRPSSISTSSDDSSS